MKIIYDKDNILIKVNENKRLPFASTIIVESDILHYTRSVSYFESVGKVGINLSCESSIESLIELVLKDYILFLKFYNLGVEKNSIEIAVTLHEYKDIRNQIVKFINNNIFSDSSILNFCDKRKSEIYYEIKRLIYFKNNKCENEFFNCDYKELLTKENFISLGSSRAVFKLNDDFIIKVNLTSLGEEQMHNELVIYNHNDFKDYRDILCGPLYFCRDYSIHELCTPLNHIKMFNNIDKFKLNEYFNINMPKELMLTLEEHEIDLDDCIDARNLGLSKDNKLKILDFGATMKIIEDTHDTENPYYYVLDEIVSFEEDNDLEFIPNRKIFNELNYKLLSLYGIKLQER